MTIPQMRLCERFADSILLHFKRLNIVGKHILGEDIVKVQILAYGKTISTTIPLKVISNVISNLESWQVARYEIIQELTNGLVEVGKNINGSGERKKKKKRRVK